MTCCRHCKAGNNAFLSCQNAMCHCHALQQLASERKRTDYPDPTGEQAVNNVSRKRREPKRKRGQR